MSFRDDFLTDRLKAFLERRSAPRVLAEKPNAIRDEVAALVRCLVRFAPVHDFENWWTRFEDRLAEDGQTRAWPTEGEIKKAAIAVRGKISKHPAEGTEVDPATIAARRMRNGETVGDGWLYGRRCVEMVSAGLVDPEILRRYRSGLYFSFKKVYGEETAGKIEREMIAKHNAAEILAGQVQHD